MTFNGLNGGEAGVPASKKTHPPRNYWAYLPNKRQKNVVPLQRNFKTHRACPGTSRAVGAKNTPSP